MNRDFMRSRVQRGPLGDILEKVEAGLRLSFEEGVRLYEAEDINAVGFLANIVRERLHGDRTYYNVNSTSTTRTSACCGRRASSARSARRKAQQDAYAYSLEEIFKMAETLGRGRTEFHMVGGLHPICPSTTISK